MNWLETPDSAFSPRPAWDIEAEKLKKYLEVLRERIMWLTDERAILHAQLQDQQRDIASLAQAAVRTKMFMDWMKAVHPGVIEAYTKSTEVAQRMEE